VAFRPGVSTSLAPARPLSFKILGQKLHVTPRGIVEALVVLGAFALCDPTLTSIVLGGAVCFLGEVCRIAAAGYGYQQGEMALRGPYRFVRHPYFLGTALLYFGLGLAARDPWVMGLAIFGLALTSRADVRRDEARLERRLGPEFAQYRALVPAFVPRLVPLAASAADHHGFSFDTAILKGRHRELDALLGLALAIGLFYLCMVLRGPAWFHVVATVAVGVYLAGRLLYHGLSRKPAEPVA
jgi:protein-S-isoprenylcysteine O-methyltransferase Ste14